MNRHSNTNESAAATAAATTELAAAWRRRLGGGSGYLRNLENVKRNEKVCGEKSRPSERHDFVATDETSDCGHRVSTFQFVLF
ncbi:hypothetical protein TIFTF001_048410 [Ficus carica]|uniref:Uncharacterized protein n=1 Tax=Ficus carica TaxID=3494 RepID=A0AA87ZL51_FICCA|nr:hypothetical protein TIFTF001_048410 [Ficus carica]